MKPNKKKKNRWTQSHGKRRRRKVRPKTSVFVRGFQAGSNNRDAYDRHVHPTRKRMPHIKQKSASFVCPPKYFLWSWWRWRLDKPVKFYTFEAFNPLGLISYTNYMKQCPIQYKNNVQKTNVNQKPFSIRRWKNKQRWRIKRKQKRKKRKRKQKHKIKSKKRQVPVRTSKHIAIIKAPRTIWYKRRHYLNRRKRVHARRTEIEEKARQLGYTGPVFSHCDTNAIQVPDGLKLQKHEGFTHISNYKRKKPKNSCLIQ